MTLVVTAPGKVILFGEHAVCFGKKAIATAIGRKTTVEVNCNSDFDCVSLNLIDLVFHVKWPLKQLSEIKLDSLIGKPTEGDGNGDNEKIIYYNEEIGKFLHDIVLSGINCANNGDIKNEIASKNDVILSAIESSKSFLFLYLSMTSCYLNKECIPMAVSLSSNIPFGSGLGSSSAFSVSLAGALLKCLLQSKPDNQLINKWAFQSERLFHGKPSGIDNNIAVAGGSLMFHEDSISHSKSMRLTRIALVDTQVKRNTKTLVARTISRRQMFPEIINSVMDAIGDISTKAWLHMNGDDSYDLNTLVEMNQCLLNCLGAGHSAIDKVLTIAKKHGFQGKLTGAGGGGSVIIFIDDTPGKSVEKMLYDLNSNGFKAQTIQVNCPGISFQ